MVTETIHKSGLYWTESTLYRKDKDSITGRCYVFPVGVSYKLSSEDLKYLCKNIKDYEYWNLSFNTNGFHVIIMNLNSGGRVVYPINPSTLWTANDLIEEGLVKDIEVIPVEESEYEILRKYC